MEITKFERGLVGRVAIVTGAAVGNGRAFCERLAQEGAKVVIADVQNSDELASRLREEGAEVVCVQADLTNPVDVERVAATAIQTFGQIDILVHNVGYYHEEPFELLPFDEWKRTMEITLDSAYHMVRSVLPQMKKQGFGRIITFQAIRCGSVRRI